MAAITLKKLTKDFNGRPAVKGIDLLIEKGECFALLGQNGAGKTTTIKMLCCLLPPTSGDATLLGSSIVTDSGAVKQKINLSPQETAVAAKLTVLENLVLAAEIYGAGKAQARAKAEAMLERFHLADRRNDKAKTLSGGLRRRLSIAMALISEPAILFLDEPTLGLDVRARRDLWKVIESLRGQVTIILTTHYLEEVEALTDRLAILHQGEVRAVGTVEEVKAAAGKESFEEAFLALTDEGEVY